MREETDELDEPLGSGDSDETTVLLREEVNELGDPLGSGEVDEFEVPLGSGEVDELDDSDGSGGLDELEVPLGKDEDVLLVKFGSQLPLPVSVTEEVVPPVVPSLLTTKLPQTPKSMLWLCKTRALGCV